MQKLTFVNRLGEELQFFNTAPYVFWKISGVETPDAEISYTKAPGQHGYTLNQLVLQQRIVKITGHVHGGINRDMFDLRKQAATVCSPTLGCGVLKYENDAGKWIIEAFCKNFRYGEKSVGIQTIEITFECPSPFWLAEEKNTISLAYVEGGMQFPLSFPSFFGFLGYQAEIVNDGNTEIPVTVTIDGGALNPVIKNVTTGSKIQVKKKFEYGDKLVVNTDPDNIYIQMIKTDPATNLPLNENAFGYLTDDSELFTLVPGVNELLFLSDDDNQRVSVTIDYRQRYTGV